VNLLDYAIKASRALRRAGLRYALVGGLACILMGVQRITEDADFIVEALSENDVERLVTELRNEGIPVSLREALGAFRDRGHFTVIVDRFRLDFKFQSSRLDAETLERAVEVEVPEGRIRIARLEELVVAKVATLGSLKDLEDALWLAIQYKHQIDWERVHHLLGTDLSEVIDSLLARIEAEYPESYAVRTKVRELRDKLHYLKKLKG